jgi:hypothetical protein
VEIQAAGDAAMKLNFKGEWKGIATIGIISAFLLISHSGFAALIPFRLVPKAPVVDNEEKLIGRLIRDDEYELSPEWLLRRDGEMRVNYKGKTVYEEHLGESQWKPLILPDTAGSGYLKDLNGDTDPDFVIEQTTNQDGIEHFNYTLYTIADGHVRRFASQDSPKPWSFRDFNKDGVYELVQSDVSFIDFANSTHLGQPQDVVCSWGTPRWYFATDLMLHKQLKPAQLDKLAEDISSKIIRYDTVDTTSGKPAKRIEIHPNAWMPIVELIYHGDAAQAKQVLNRVWKADETAMLDTGSDTVTDRETFWKQIWSRIETSPFASELKSMNNISS